MRFQKYIKSVRKKQPYQKNISRKSRLLVEGLENRIVPANFLPGDLAVLQAAASASNTTASILELLPNSPNQASPIQNIGVSGDGTNAIRVSGSAATTGYLADSNDGTFLTFTGANSAVTSGNANTLNPRAVVALDFATNITLPTTYTGVSGNQTRGASTLDDTNWYIGDQGGIYTNGTTGGSLAGNFRSVKAFGGTVYAFIASASSPPVGTLATPSGAAFTSLAGLPSGTTSAQDFYLIQSGNNGSTFDVLYVLSATSATAGTIAKFSLVSGSWTANGTYTTSFGGFGLAAANNGSGGSSLYVTTGTGATSTNQVIELTDAAGFNSVINITTANNVTLYTAAAGAILKGIAFAPVANTATTTAVTNVTPLNSGTSQAITFTANVTATSGSSAPAAGVVEFIDSGASGRVLATATTASTNGAISTFTVSTIVPAGTYSNIRAYYIANAGSNFSSSVSAVYGSTLSIGTATTTAITNISPTTTTTGQPITFTATVAATSGSAAPGAGSVEFFNGGLSGTLLATATTETTNGTTATFTVTTSSIAAGNYSSVQAFYIPGNGFVNSNSPVFGSTLSVIPAGVIAAWTFPATASSPYNSPAPTFGSGAAITLGMTNTYNGGNAANDDVVLTAGTANAALSENTWRIRGTANNGWATAAAGAAAYTQGVELDTSTVGKSNIVFSFDWYATSSGIRDLQVEYNTNTANPNGWTKYVGPSPTGTFVATPNDYFNAGLSPVNPTIYVNLSSIAAANNDPNLGIRLVSAFDSTGNVHNDYASATLDTNGHTVLYANGSGNWRFGNLTFSYGTTTTTAVSATPTTTQTFGGNVTFTATVTPASGGVNPSGAVAFFDGLTQIGTTQALTAGGGNTATASITISTLTVGAHNITAQYLAATGGGFINSGSSMSVAAGSNPLAYTVTGINTTSTLTANLPSPQALFTPITFTDTIAPASGSTFPTGTVKFFDGSTQIGATQTVTAGTGTSGTASVTVSTLALGAHNITAQFFPNGAFGGSTSSILPETIIASLTTPIISEFLASNQGVLLDAAGESSDWIEVYNPTSAAIDLLGYSLTDDASNPTKWQFPHDTLAAGAYQIVFADGENISTGTELHTNFSISAGGGYLALVDPNGTVISQYQYPAQVGDVSYGVNFNATTLVAPGAIAQTLIPTDSSLGTTWTNPNVDTTSWIHGTTGVGFGIQQPGFNVTYVQANTTIGSVATAQQVLATPSLQTVNVNTNAPTINYFGSGPGGDFTSSDVPFPTQTGGVEVDNFAIQAIGTVTIPAAGNWSFNVNSDDGFQLTLTNGTQTFTSQFTTPRSPTDTVATFNIPQAGSWTATLIYFQDGGGANVDLSAAQGTYTQFTPGVFQLIGDTAHGGLAVASTPASDSNLTIGTNVASAMLGINSSAYIRIPFTVANPSAFNQLQLSMLYDDGFVAYLNGVEVARANAPSTLVFNSAATAQQTIAQTAPSQIFGLASYLNLLQPGTNVLAIQGLNSSASDSSFLVLPTLVGSNVNTAQASYFVNPTPGAPNSTPSLGVAGTVSASVPDGFYTSAISVTLSTSTPGATIYYTLNGSAPTATNGAIYSGPIPISSTTTLRAVAIESGYITLPSVTWTYIYVADVMTQSLHDGTGLPATGAAPSGWPATWGSNAVNYGLDEKAIQAEGAANVQAGLQALPVMAISTDLSNLFGASTGIYSNASNNALKVPASIELINPSGVQGFQIDAGLSIRGGFSQSTGNPKHGFHITFSTDYGPSSLDYPLFGDAPGVATTFDGIDLRTQQNSSWQFTNDSNATMMEDPFERGSQGAMGQITTHSLWVSVYIDGQYWGIYEIEERINPLFASTYLNEPKTDPYDILKAENGSYVIGAEKGNTNAYYALWQYVTTHDMSNNANYYFIQGKNAQGVNDPTIPNSDVLLNPANLIDYMMLIYQGGNQDGPISLPLSNTGINNFYAVRDEDGREGFVFLQHDDEQTFQDVNVNRTGPFNLGGANDFNHFNPQYLFQVLTANPEFKQAFEDEVLKQFNGNGAMTNANMLARYQALASGISVAINAESARWGDAQNPTNPYTITNWNSGLSWQENILLNRNAVVLQQLATQGWLSTVTAPQYLVNGVAESFGHFTAGSNLTFSNTGGLIYFTTDGSDPRLIGGGINPLAQVYNPGQSGPALVLTQSVQLKARALNGSTWSALSQATLSNSVAAAAGNLAITELQYEAIPDASATAEPDDIAANFQFIELRNIGTVSIDLSGVRFSEGIGFNFDDGAVHFLNPGQSVVVVSNLQAFGDRYGPAPLVAGVFTGGLKDDGETITLLDATSAIIQSFAYSNAASWPQTPRGQGPSLTVVDVNGNYNDPSNWRASFAPLGTPGYNEGVDTVPAAPTNLQSTFSGYTSTSTTAPIANLLTWTGSPGANQYIIQRKTGSGGTYQQVGASTTSAFFDSGLAPGTTYYYTVSGVNAVGAGSPSAAFAVTTPIAPPAASAAQVTGATATTISLQWTDNAGTAANGYLVLRSTNGSAYVQVASLPPASTTPPGTYTWTDTNLSPASLYSYQIYAFNIAGPGIVASVSGTTRVAAPYLAYVQITSTTATLNYTIPTGATGINIYRGTASGNETFLTSTGVSSSSYVDHSVVNGTTYYYYVTAVNANAAPVANAESAPSNELSPSSASGAFTWSGAGSDSNWTTGANWQGGVAPIGNGNFTLVFPGGAARSTNIDNLPANGNAFAGITANASGYNITFNNPLVLVSGGLSLTVAGTENISAASTGVGIYLVNGESFSTTSGSTLTVGPNITEVGGALTIAGGGNTVLGGSLSGLGGLTSNESGTLTLSGASAYTGPTLISAGTVNANSSTALGVNSDVTVAPSAVLVVGTSSLQIGSLTGAGTVALGANQLVVGGSNHAASFTGPLSGLTASNVTKTGAATQIIGQPTYTGTTTINGGTLQFGDGTHAFTAIPAGAIADNGTLTIAVPTGSALTYSNAISGSGAVTVTGTGTLTLSSLNNTYTGGTTVFAGTLISATSTSLGTGPATTAGGILDLSTQPVGFNGTGTGWTLNGGATIANNDLAITTNAGSEARSAYYNQVVPVSTFSASYTYTDTTGGGADGTVFTLQNVGPTAVGGAGGSLGFGGMGVQSFGVAFNVYSPNTVGYEFVTGAGGITTPYTATGNVNLASTTPVNVTLTYNGTTLTMTLTQGSNTYTASATLNLVSILGGSTAYVGFTGGTGGASAQQDITNFAYSASGAGGSVGSAYSNNFIVPAGSAGTIQVSPGSGQSTVTVGNLTTGAGSSLSVIGPTVPTLTGVTSLSGFGTTGVGWTSNGGPTVAADVLTVTTAAANETRSFWYNQKVATGGNWTATYRYTDVSTNGANGVVFVLQNSSTGTAALGGNSASLGYSGIGNSLGFAINVLSSSTQGVGQFTNGTITTPFTSTGPVAVANGSPVTVTLSYNYATTTLTATLTQGTNTFTKTYTVNVPNLLGSSAFIGFTGSTGATNAKQTVDSFSFSASVPSVSYGLKVGQVNLSGADSITINNTTNGTGTLTLGALNDAGTAASLTINGSGGTVFSAPATSLAAATSLNLAGSGTFTIGASGAFGVGPMLTVGNASTLNLNGNGTTISALSGAGVVRDASATSATLTIAQNTAPTTFTGVLTNGVGGGVLSVTKTGTGTQILTGAETYTGPTGVLNGTLGLIGSTASLSSASSVSIGAAGTIAGNGTINGSIVSAGMVEPASSSGLDVAAPGSLKTAALSFTSTGAYSVDLAGTTAGSGYSQLTATGAINLAGAALNLSVGSGFHPAVGTVFDILVNSSGAAISGAFANLAQGATVTAPGGDQYTISYLGGSSGHDVILTRLASAITTIAGVVVGDGITADGTTQRSEVRQITVTFSGPVTFAGGNANAAAAFQLQHLEDGVNIANLQAAVSTNASNQTVVVLTFTTVGNSATEVDPISLLGNATLVPGASLADGRYQLTILAANVTGLGGLALAGNGTTAGANYVSPSDTLGGGSGQLRLYRLFGDANGDGVVDQVDLAQFRTSFNSSSTTSPFYLAFLDADNNGVVDQVDLGQFRSRFNMNVY